MLNPARCQQVIYFSTASVLDRHNNLLQKAGEIGTDYIRSKYNCLSQLSNLAIAAKITVLFPTLVLGGDGQKPYSHLSAGLPEVTKLINLIRFLKADGSFHLGQERLTVNQAIEEFCAYLDKKIYFRIPLSLSLANVLIILFRIQMAAWDRFCLNYRHFTYENIVNPAKLSLPNYCATLADVLKLSGSPSKSPKV